MISNGRLKLQLNIFMVLMICLPFLPGELPWPISRYNMFGQYTTAGSFIYRIHIIKQDSSIETYRPWELISMEFYRVNDLIYRLYESGPKEAQAQKFCLQLRNKSQAVSGVQIVKLNSLSPQLPVEIIYSC